MKLLPIPKLNKALDKALLKYRPFDSEIDLFKSELVNLIDNIDNRETEEFHKNLVSTFLNNVFYANTHFINTKGRQDLVIHNGKDNKTKVGVILEAKRPSNKVDWFTPDKPNSKALHELILYYLRERIEEKNIDIKYLIATNINEWYIFEASYFDKLFYHNKDFVKQYEEWRDGKKVTKDTGLFYNDIAKPFIDSLTDEIPCTYFDINEHEKALRSGNAETNNDLKALFKILSPYHLLKAQFANDSNELNDKFYKELLHIIGLEEVKEGGKIIIRRKIENRNTASLLERAIDELQTEGLHKVPDLKSFGETNEEQYFNIALELCITWVNRVLFLKLLEGQLINYHKGNQQYRFLNNQTIPNFIELFDLFHKVLAVDIPSRSQVIQQKYKLVPYLNSSLFEISELEDVTIKIKDIESAETLDFINSTILKEQKKKNEHLKTIDYLFQFLDAYDFASEDTGDTRKDNKTLINASVLGKVFEKINGYKDGSIYTPGFITMYMSRQTIRLAVKQKFNDAYGWTCKDFEDLKEKLAYEIPEERNKANAIINDLKICDPAVGSGHFLVSALNEIIAIKSELKILQDVVHGKRLKEYDIAVVNDELIITDEDSEIFIYKPLSPQSQLIQQTLFTEKQTIIENCLFGVDINPNSVKICRLRLWIELLKNAYYKEDGNLETLPNIDINIKCGNSLLSRFALDADLSKALRSIKHNINAYRGFVNDYKNCKDRELKRGLQFIIDQIKADFRTEISRNAKEYQELSKLRGQLYKLLSTNEDLFGEKKKNKEDLEFEKRRLELSIEQKEKAIEDIKNNAIYKNAFEWRFEFPEVLNNNGDFEGFDLIIGNPPYMVISDEKIKKHYESFYLEFKRNNDLYVAFIKMAFPLLKNNSVFSFITPNTFIKGNYFKSIRSYITNHSQILEIVDFGNSIIFEGINVYCAITTALKQIPKNKWQLKSDTIKIKGFIEPFITDFIIKNDLVTKLNNLPKFENYFHIKDVGFNYWTEGRGKVRGGSIGSRVLYQGIKENEKDIPYIKGGDISKYKINFSNNYLRHNWKLFLDKNDTFRFSQEFFEKASKIVYRQTSNKIIAALDLNQNFNDKTIHIIINKEQHDFDLRFVLAILNSKLLNYFFQAFKEEEGRAFAQVKGIDVKNLPFKDFSKVKAEPIIDLVNEIVISKQNSIDTTNLEQQIDTLVYQLYELTTDEIAIIENSTNTK